MEFIAGTFLIFALIVLFVFLVRSFAYFNRLIELEYARYNTEWIKDGKPAGMYYRLPVARGLEALLRQIVCPLYGSSELQIGLKMTSRQRHY